MVTAMNQCVSLGRRALHQLRASLERDTGLQSANYLQEAGFAGGEELFQQFAGWLAQQYGITDPGDLAADHLGEVLTAFFSGTGWGDVAVTRLSPALIALDSANWSEADPGAGAQYPSCHLTSGMLADFLSRVAGTTVGVMEVECLSRNEARCRFLAGGPEALQTLYERMALGQTYEEAME